MKNIESMNAKEYLCQLKEINNLIEANREEVTRLEDMLTNMTSSFKDIIIHSSMTNDKIGNKAPEIAELQTEIKCYIKELATIESNALRVIRRIKPLKLQTVLIKYYIQNKTFEQTAVEMNMTYRWICELHGQALQMYDKINKYLDNT